MKNVLVHQLQPDLYMNAVLYALRSRPQVTEVQVSKDGLWRAGEGEEWQDIRNGPPESFQLPPKREDIAEGDAGASSSSCPFRGQKRAREEAPKVPVAVLNGQHQGAAVGSQARQTTAVAPPPRPSNNAGAATLAAHKSAEKTVDVITISDSDDDVAAAPAAAPVAVSHSAHAMPAPVRVSNTTSSPSALVKSVMPLHAITSAPSLVPPVHLQSHSPNATAHAPSHAVNHPMVLAPPLPAVRGVMPPVTQLPMPALPQAQPVGYGGHIQQSHRQSAPAPPAYDLQRRQLTTSSVAGGYNYNLHRNSQ
jgi:hypothetical protein